MDLGDTPTEDDNPAPAKPKPRLRIESSGSIWGEPGTKVYLDNVDISRIVSAVTWHIEVGKATTGGFATATVTFIEAKISAEADLATPDREALVRDNPALAQQIREGIAQAEAGETVDLGSFAHYLDDEAGPES